MVEPLVSSQAPTIFYLGYAVIQGFPRHNQPQGFDTCHSTIANVEFTNQYPSLEKNDEHIGTYR